MRVAELRFGSTRRGSPTPTADADAHEHDLGPNDQKRIVANLVEAAARRGHPSPRRPWLDDLASTSTCAPPARRRRRIPLGVADIPERQAQAPVFFEPDTDGHLLVYGTSGAGKSDGAAHDRDGGRRAARRAGGVEVYGLDFGTGSLRSLEALPHVGSIVPGDDAERVQRLLRTLAACSTTAPSGSRRPTPRNLTRVPRTHRSRARAPRSSCSSTDFGTFKQEWEATSARSPFYNDLHARCSARAARSASTRSRRADRYGAVPTAVSANVTTRIVLRMSDEGAYSILGAPKDVLNERSAPGRAIVDGFETQLAVIGGTANVAEQTAGSRAFADALRAAGVRRRSREIGALPTELAADELPASRRRAAGDRHLRRPRSGPKGSSRSARSWSPVRRGAASRMPSVRS